MNVSRNLVRNLVTSTKTSAAAATPKPGNIAPGYFELAKVQQKFQVKDGKPVFLKGGAFDQVLYRFTMGLSLVGLGGIVHLIYQLSCPKRD